VTASRFLSLAAMVALAACGNGPRLGESSAPMAVTKLSELPAPGGADLTAPNSPYRVGPLDKLAVTVFGVPELSGKFQVDGAGNLSLPLIGEIAVSGLTPTELSRTIDHRLRGVYVKDPQVSVNLEEATSQVYTVDGQVGQPGSYPAVGNMSLMRAVANAKGTGEYARLDDVVVFRTVGGQSMAALYNLAAIRRGLYPDPKIYANDIIIVGDSTARRQFQQFLQVAPLLTTPIVLALQRVH